MILAHLSDLHLGFRGHGRRERGRDARERDVLDALERAVGELVDLGPDAVVVTGDVFDRPDPDPSVLLAFTRALEAVRAALPDVPVALLAGPRDLPLHESEPGVLDVLSAWPGVTVASREAVSLSPGDGRLHLALVPHGALVGEAARAGPPEVDPDPAARFNVLAAHGRVGRAGGPGRRGWPALEVDHARWDYVALGGEHAHRQVARTAHYAGSLERVGWTPWSEALEEKGFVTVDLEKGAVSFHPLPVRPVVALAPIRVARGDTPRLIRRVREVASEVPGGIDGRIVRLRLQGPSPDDLRALQDGLLEDLRSRALHLGLGVEEADDPSPPVADLARRLGLFLEAEGGDPAGAETLLPRPVQAPPRGAVRPRPLRLEAAELRLPPRGLVALVGREPGERVALARALRDAVGDDAPDRATSAALLEEAARRIASPWLEAVEAALERVRRGETPRVDGDDDAASGRRAREAAPGELRALERELSELRADDAELAGDVEQAAMEWTRERQDADTQLQAYRDRARELKVRLRQLESAGSATPCPTCGRPLADHFEDVVSTLREDWEGVVQDGRWWKRRREQLEEKPERLRELEGRALRMHAALEVCAEKLEAARARAAEGAAAERPRHTPAAPGDREPAPDSAPEARALARLRDERLAAARGRAVLRASRVVEQLTAGRIVFLAIDPDGVPAPQAASGPLSDPAGEEDAAVRLALRAVAAVARPTDTLLLPEGTLEALAASDALRAVDVLRSLLRTMPRVLVITDGRVVDRRPEAFDHAFELEREGREARARPLPVGTGSVVLSG